MLNIFHLLPPLTPNKSNLENSKLNDKHFLSIEPSSYKIHGFVPVMFFIHKFIRINTGIFLFFKPDISNLVAIEVIKNKKNLAQYLKNYSSFAKRNTQGHGVLIPL